MLTTAMLTKLADLRGARRVAFFIATNRLAALDAAVTRPGRFDLQLFVGTPNLPSRLGRFRARLDATSLDEAAKRAVRIPAPPCRPHAHACSTGLPLPLRVLDSRAHRPPRPSRRPSPAAGPPRPSSSPTLRLSASPPTPPRSSSRARGRAPRRAARAAARTSSRRSWARASRRASTRCSTRRCDLPSISHANKTCTRATRTSRALAGPDDDGARQRA